MKTTNLRRTILFFYIVMSLYCFGASMLDYFGIYKPWKLVGVTEFAAFHQYQGTMIIRVFVLPLVITTILGIISCIFRDKAINKFWLWLSMMGIMIAWVLSFAIQIPIQFKLDEGKDMQLIDELLSTNWYRIAASFLHLFFVLMLLWQLVKPRYQQIAVA